MLSITQFRDLIIRPTLLRIDLHSPAAEKLLLGTAIAESDLRYVRQVANGGHFGPARGFFQMEPATHDDIWANYLRYKASLGNRVRRTSSYFSGVHPDADEMIANAAYACAMARVHYLRRPEALPHEDDLWGIACYWKQWFNTPLGAGTPEKFIARIGDALDF